MSAWDKFVKQDTSWYNNLYFSQTRIEKATIVLDSYLTCKNCSGKKIVIDAKQTRRADEGETIFFHCTTCGSRWKE